jgi:DNA-binding beta-propeller fold protein YncE
MLVTSGFIMSIVIYVVTIVFAYLVFNVTLKEGLLMNNSSANSGFITRGSTLTPIIASDSNNLVLQYDPKSGLNINKFKLTDGIGAILNLNDMYCYVCTNEDYITILDLMKGFVLNVKTGLFPVAVVDDGNFVWVVNKGSSTISLLDMQSNLVKNTVDCKGTIPVDIAYNGNNRMYVALAGSKQLVEYNVWTLENKVFFIGDNENIPIKIAYDGMGKVWILGSHGLVQSLNTATNPYILTEEMRFAGATPTTIFADVSHFYIGDSSGRVQSFISSTNQLNSTINHDTNPIVGLMSMDFDIYVMSNAGKFARYNTAGNLIVEYIPYEST